ncbi:MAG: hypothetical protein CSA62_13550 [Planctomycetota bacterium]|nr:MAG: hypothetical protein CSA62_13550 [Planctomycetota bacterium]
MLRRSLYVFLAFTFLVLVMTLGYSALNQSGPKQAIARAETQLRDGEAPQAIRLLHEAQRALGPAGDKALIERIGRLRYRAQMAVGNFERALRDLNWLIEDRKLADPALKRDRVRVLLLAGNTDKAISSVEAVLAEQPGHTELFELAGRALQQRYSKEIRKLRSTEFPTLLGARKGALATKVLRRLVFRPNQDQAAEKLQAQLFGLLREEIADSSSYEELSARIRLLRVDVRRSHEYYRQALESEIPRLPALAGFSEQLSAGGHLLDAALLSWIYLQRSAKSAVDPDLEFALEFARDESEQEDADEEHPLQWSKGADYARVVAADVAIRAFDALKLPRMVLAAGQQWLGKGGAQAFLARHAKRKSLQRCLRCFVGIGRAQAKLGDQDGLEDLVGELETFQQKEERWLGPSLIFLQGLLASTRQEQNNAAGLMKEFQRHANPTPPPASIPDIWSESMRIRIAAAEAQHKDQLSRDLYSKWIEARPSKPEIRLERAKLRLQQKEALLVAYDAEVLIQAGAEYREEALGLLLQAKELQYRPSKRGSIDLFHELIRKGRTIPLHTAHPVLHLGIAGYALSQRALAIAERNARIALQTYPWSTQARSLLATAQLLQGDAEQAAHQCRALLLDDPQHLLALELQLQALTKSQASQLEIQRAALELMRAHPTHARSALAFGEALLRREAYKEALLLVENAPAAKSIAHEASFQWIAARAHVGLGDLPSATAGILNLPEGFAALPQALQLGIECAAKLGSTKELGALLDQLLSSAASGAQLLEIAEKLLELRHPREALRLIQGISDGGDRTKDVRDGPFFLTWGRLLLGAGKVQQAKPRLEASLSFEGGSPALSLLVAESLLEGRPKEAAEYRAQVAQLEAGPALLAWIEAMTLERSQALAKARKLSLPVRRLGPALEYAIALYDPERDSPAEEEPAGAPKLEWSGLKALVRAAPQEFLNALLLAQEPAFAERALDAAKLILELKVPDAVKAQASGWQRIVQGNVLESLGRDKDALKAYLQVVHDLPLFAPGYRELFRVARRVDPEILGSADLIARYLAFYKAGFAAIEPEVLVVLCQVVAASEEKQGKSDEAKTLLQAAKNLLQKSENLDPEQPQLLSAFFHSKLQRGETISALADASILLRKQKGKELRETLNLAYKAAYELVRADGPGEPDSEHRKEILFWVRQAAAHLNQDSDPLAYALALRLSALPFEAMLDIQGQVIEKPARQLCSQWIDKFERSNKRVVKLRALAGVFRAWLEQDDPSFVETQMERVLARDPSLLDLWLLRAEICEKQGRSNDAIKTLAWLRHLTPVPVLLSRLARLAALYGQGHAELRNDLLANLPADDKPSLELARGLLLFRAGDFEKAQLLLRNCSKQGRTVCRYVADLAAIMLKQEKSYAAAASRLEALPASTPPFENAGAVATQLRLLLQEKNRPRPAK